MLRNLNNNLRRMKKNNDIHKSISYFGFYNTSKMTCREVKGCSVDFMKDYVRGRSRKPLLDFFQNEFNTFDKENDM